MNTRQDALTQGIVSEFTQDTTNKLKCRPLFDDDLETRRALELGPRFVDIYIPPQGMWPNSHVPGVACRSRARADMLVIPYSRLRRAYRIVVKAKRP